MFVDSIAFGIAAEDGDPYVQTCRSTFTFDTVENAAFAAAPILPPRASHPSLRPTTSIGGAD